MSPGETKVPRAETSDFFSRTTCLEQPEGAGEAAGATSATESHSSRRGLGAGISSVAPIRGFLIDLHTRIMFSPFPGHSQSYLTTVVPGRWGPGLEHCPDAGEDYLTFKGTESLARGHQARWMRWL